jgi:hypothetical protein
VLRPASTEPSEADGLKPTAIKQHRLFDVLVQIQKIGDPQKILKKKRVSSQISEPAALNSMSNQTAYGMPTSNYAQNYAYTPTHNPGNASMSLHDRDESTLYDEHAPMPRTFSRTPSPTPSEFNALNGIKEKKTMKETISALSLRNVVL